MAFLDYRLDIAPESRWNMIFPTSTAKASFLYIQEIGHFLAGPNYFTRRDGYDSFLLKYTISGCGKMEYNGKTWIIPQGTMFWVDCKTPNRYCTDPEVGTWDMLWIHFYGANARAYYEAFLNYNNGEPVIHLPKGNTVAHTLQALLALDNSGNRQFEADLRAATLLTQLVSECTLSAMHFSINANVPKIVQEIQLHLQKTFRQQSSLENLGNRFNLNPFYLQKLFKRYIGQSPNEYCIYLRISHAKELLRTTHKSISEIAYASGIENLGYFTRLFKKHEGLTPQEYRTLWPILPEFQNQLSGSVPFPYRSE